MSPKQSMVQKLSVSSRSNEAKRRPMAGSKAYYVILLIVLAAILVPIWIVRYPGMIDLPNHLARCYIIAHYHDNPIWQQRYLVVYAPKPNLAIDLIVTPLARFLPLMVCGKIFVSLAATLFVVGCSEVGRAITGKLNWLALIASFTFYNMYLFDGFINYIFGVSVFLCAFAYWLHVRNAMTPIRFSLCCLLSTASFLSHLSSIVILGVACGTVALIDLVRDRKFFGFILKLSWLAFPLLLMAAFMKSGGGHVGTVTWWPLAERLPNILAPLSSYSRLLNVAIAAILLVCAVPILRRSKVHPAAIAGLVLLVLFLISPDELFTATHVAERFVVPGYLLLVLSIEPRWGRWQKAAIAVGLAAMAFRVAAITADWLIISHRSEMALDMGQVLPEGARIFVLKSMPDPTPKVDRGLLQVIELWTVSHDAYLSTFFGSPSQCRRPSGNVVYRPSAGIRQFDIICAAGARHRSIIVWKA